MIKSKPLALLALFVASTAYAYTTTVNMNLKTPASGDTDYPTSIADSFTLIDAHDHTSGKGVQIPTGGIANAAITGAKLAAAIVDNSTIEISTNVLQVKDSGIIDAKIASNAVTTAKILDANVTAAKIVTNVSLLGNAVQEAGKNLVVSGTNAATSLAIVRGTVNSGGSLSVGEGFSSVKNSTGNYTITFTNAFASSGVTTITPLNGIAIANITATSASAFTVNFTTTAAVNLDKDFSFISIGPR